LFASFTYLQQYLIKFQIFVKTSFLILEKFFYRNLILFPLQLQIYLVLLITVSMLWLNKNKVDIRLGYLMYLIKLLVLLFDPF
jgi:hypothetical protein